MAPPRRVASGAAGAAGAGARAAGTGEVAARTEAALGVAGMAGAGMVGSVAFESKGHAPVFSRQMLRCAAAAVHLAWVGRAGRLGTTAHAERELPASWRLRERRASAPGAFTIAV